MPNWVTNYLSVKKENLDKILNKDEEVDFSLLCPMPEALENTSSPVMPDYIYLVLSKDCTKPVNEADRKKYGIQDRDIVHAKELLESDTKGYFHIPLGNERYFDNKEMLTKEEHLKEVRELGQQYIDNIDKYGVADWYDWRCENWGCKWNASETEIFTPLDEVKDGEFVEIQFNTPWSPPIGWLNKVAEAGIEHRLAWYEEQGYRGICVFDGERAEQFDLIDDYAFEQENGEIVWLSEIECEHDIHWADMQYKGEYEELCKEKGLDIQEILHKYMPELEEDEHDIEER